MEGIQQLAANIVKDWEGLLMTDEFKHVVRG